MVLYRKYRPQKISDLDSEIIRTRLRGILSSPYTPHAFLFSGPKGTGKTSTARIVAKILNCETRNNKPEPKNEANLNKPTTNDQQLTTKLEPCNTCESCKAITNGSHMDILEIDAASNRGIDEMRDLREKIKLAPSSAKFKVYIIDEVHMLTQEAFNALLKTLEEPPEHAVFILATTQPDKLPDTIVSRCIRLDFRKASTDEIIHSLKRVIQGEDLKISDSVLNIIAEASDGSFRDATKIMEQAIADDSLSEDKVTLLLGRSRGHAGVLLKLMKNRQTDKALILLTELSRDGISAKSLTEEILRSLHHLLLAHFQIDVQMVPEDLRGCFTKDEINGLIKLYSGVYVDLKNSSNPFLPLEIAVVEWCES